MKNSTFISFDGEEIYYSIWNEVLNPKGVLQIIHGMAEHSGRYDDLATYLNTLGFVVYATDHRDHGKSAKNIKDIGYVEENGIFNMVKDEHLFTKLIKEKYPNLPYFILGHSMGSFILQKYLQQLGVSVFINNNQNYINGAIIMGSAFASPEYYLGRGIAWFLLKVFGDKVMKNLENIIFQKLGLKFVAKYAHNLITRDKEALKKYKQDPYCAMVFSARFYYELFNFMIDVFKRYNMECININTPLFIVSGKGDFVGGESKKIRKLYKEYVNIGCKDIIKRMYKNSLHEIIHDKDKLAVYNDIKNWIIERC